MTKKLWGKEIILVCPKCGWTHNVWKELENQKGISVRPLRNHINGLLYHGSPFKKHYDKYCKKYFYTGCPKGATKKDIIVIGYSRWDRLQDNIDEKQFEFRLFLALLKWQLFG